MKPRADRADRTFQHSGRRFVAHLLQIAEHNDLAVMSGKTQYGFANAGDRFSAAQIHRSDDVPWVRPIASRAVIQFGRTATWF